MGIKKQQNFDISLYSDIRRARLPRTASPSKTFAKPMSSASCEDSIRHHYEKIFHTKNILEKSLSFKSSEPFQVGHGNLLFEAGKNVPH